MFPSEQSDDGHRVRYCLIPPDLAPKLHELLRRHFASAELAVEVVVERRREERRRGGERRGELPVSRGELPGSRGDVERRRIRARSGRRAGDRRAAQIAQIALPAPLPRRARRHADRISFVERIEPSSEQLEDLDTARVVTCFQAGDREDAFTILYRRYFGRVYGYMRVLLQSAEDSEDAAQRVFGRVFEALPGYERREQPFRAWLFTIARNDAVGELRKRGRTEAEDPAAIDRRRDRPVTPESGSPAALDWVSDPDLVLFLQRLPVAQRQVLAMRFLLGMRVSEIAEVLGRAPNDVSKLQHRALAYLRQRLDAVGRRTRRDRRIGFRHRPKQAVVLRERRFALFG